MVSLHIFLLKYEIHIFGILVHLFLLKYVIHIIGHYILGGGESNPSASRCTIDTRSLGYNSLSYINGWSHHKLISEIHYY